MGLTYENKVIEELLMKSNFRKNYADFADRFNSLLESKLRYDPKLQESYAARHILDGIPKYYENPIDYLPSLYAIREELCSTLELRITLEELLAGEEFVDEILTEYCNADGAERFNQSLFIRLYNFYSEYKYYKSYEYYYWNNLQTNIEYDDLADLKTQDIPIQYIEDYIIFRYNLMKNNNEIDFSRAYFINPCYFYFENKLIGERGREYLRNSVYSGFKNKLHYFVGSWDYNAYRVLEALPNNNEIVDFMDRMNRINFVGLEATSGGFNTSEWRNWSELNSVNTQFKLDMKKLLEVYGEDIPMEWCIEIAKI